MQTFEQVDEQTMRECPVRCGFHRQASYFLYTNALDGLRANLDIYGKASRTTWRNCRCNLYARILAAVHG